MRIFCVNYSTLGKQLKIKQKSTNQLEKLRKTIISESTELVHILSDPSDPSSPSSSSSNANKPFHYYPSSSSLSKAIQESPGRLSLSATKYLHLARDPKEARHFNTNTRPPLAGPYAFSRLPKPRWNRPRVYLMHDIRDTWLFLNFSSG